MKIILQIVHSAHTYIMQSVQLKIRESWKPSYMIYATHKAIFEISFETESTAGINDGSVSRFNLKR